jgi:NAD(P)H dehydrogenase (quinone)
MVQPIILVIFYSRSGATEKLALAAGVGAVQERALIRLRRLPDLNPQEVIERFPRSKEALVRMQKEYVSPAESDLLAADAIIFAMPRDLKTSEDWKPHLDMLARLRSEGRLEGKLVATLTSTTVEEATEQGRKVAAMAREAKKRIIEP